MKKIVFALVLLFSFMFSQTASAATLNWVSGVSAPTTNSYGNGTESIGLTQALPKVVTGFSYTYGFTVSPIEAVNSVLNSVVTFGDLGGITFTSLLLDGNAMSFDSGYNGWVGQAIAGNGLHSLVIAGTSNSTKAKSFQLTVSAVPVPAAVWLFGSGIVGLLGASRRKNKASLALAA